MGGVAGGGGCEDVVATEVAEAAASAAATELFSSHPHEQGKHSSSSAKRVREFTAQSVTLSATLEAPFL
jgi:hypothetical protein